MNNIISSDFYRVRRGAALRNTCLGLLAIVLVVLAIMLVSQSGILSEITVAPSGMSSAETAELQQDMLDVQADTAHIDGGAAFGFEMLAQFFVPFFFLPIAIAVFCADFSAGTYRNTLSFESNRTKVYFAKLALSVGLCLAMVLGLLAASWLLGGIAFGFAGFTTAYLGHVLVTLLLQLPIYLAFVAVCHCLVSFTKKSSTTIAIFLVGYIAIAILCQVLSGMLPALDWLLLIDPMSGGKLLAMYDMVPMGNLLFVLILNSAIAVGATLLGLLHFRKADMP